MTNSNISNYATSGRGTFLLTNLLNGDFNLTVTSFSLPGLTLPAANYDIPHIQVPLHGDTLQYEDLTIEFLVDEHLSNWKQIHDWMRSLAAPEYKEKEYGKYGNVTYKYSDAVLTIFTSHNNPDFRIKFIHCVPTGLSGIGFTETDTSTTPSKATLSLAFERFDMDNC